MGLSAYQDLFTLQSLACRFFPSFVTHGDKPKRIRLEKNVQPLYIYDHEPQVPDSFILFSSPYTLHSFSRLANVDWASIMPGDYFSVSSLSTHVQPALSCPALRRWCSGKNVLTTISYSIYTHTTHPCLPTCVWPGCVLVGASPSTYAPDPSLSHPLESIASFPLGSSIIYLLVILFSIQICSLPS